MAKIKNTTPEPVKPEPTFQLDLSLEELAIINMLLGGSNGYATQRTARNGTTGDNPRSWEIVAEADPALHYNLYALTRDAVANA